MKNFISLLSTLTVWGKKYTFVGGYSWLNGVYDTLPGILWGILAAVGGAGTVYAIILGINLAKSDSDDKRKTAATRLKNTVIGISVLLGLVLIINLIIPMVINLIWGTEAVTIS